MSLDATEVMRLVRDCRAPGVTFHVGSDAPDKLWLQVHFDAADAADGVSHLWHGRKWRLSRHATKGEVVQTALKAYLTAVEHEAREHFTYCGRAIFGPHLNIDLLWGIADRPENRDSSRG